jgi:hypothetical protein
MTKTFEEVVVWQKAHQFVLLVYQITKYYPETERFGLTSQFQRAAVSIAANYCILSRDLNYISDEQYQQLRTSLSETSFMLNSYIKAILENKFKDAMK